jgi:hypothetical protein
MNTPALRGCVVNMNPNRKNFGNRLCEERSDAAISCCANNYTIEIATLPPVVRDDAGFMTQPLHTKDQS